jgi:hypothetical protein
MKKRVRQHIQARGVAAPVAWQRERPPRKSAAAFSSVPRPTESRMGSKTSKAGRPAPVKTKATAVPRLPQEIIDVILDHLAANSDFKSLVGLRSCAVVSKSWVPSCRRHLFHTILFTPKATARWIKVFPVPEESPAHHVRDLRFSTRGRTYHCTPFEYFPWFTNVEKVTWSGLEGFPPLWIPSLGRLPRSVTSLTIKADTVPLALSRDVLIQLPNLDDLSLSGFLDTAEGDALPGMGTVLRGRFGGQLRLLDGQADEDVVNMLLEVPTGLHFTELHIRGTHESFLPTVRLAEACCKTLVKLSYTVSIHGKSPLFSWLGRFWRAGCYR